MCKNVLVTFKYLYRRSDEVYLLQFITNWTAVFGMGDISIFSIKFVSGLGFVIVSLCFVLSECTFDNSKC